MDQNAFHIAFRNRKFSIFGSLGELGSEICEIQKNPVLAACLSQ